MAHAPSMGVGSGISRWRAGAATAAFVAGLAGAAAAGPGEWRAEWPNTDFSRHSVPFAEILSGGPPKDGIPAIDSPRFAAVAQVRDLADTEPVLSLVLNDDARAYPLRVLTWHEIVNDTVGGVPVTVTYCPLCNAAIVFDRRVAGRVLDFGTTGKLRKSDLVMYDRQTQSWWQQFFGEAIVGELTGASLTLVPSRLESFARFRARAPGGRVLVPSDPQARPYGRNPYVAYDSRSVPYAFFGGPFPVGIDPMARVVIVAGEAWSLDLLRRKGRLVTGDIVLEWVPGQNSALDSPQIAHGRDVGNITARRGDGAGAEDVVHHVTFAFVFHAFHPNGQVHTD